MKVYDFIIVCKRPGYKLVDGISQLMLLLSMIVFASSVEVPITSGRSILYFSLIAGITGWLIYCYFVQRKGGIPFYRLGLTLATLGWALQPDWWWMAFIAFIAAILEKQVKFPLEIAFDQEEIVVNSLPKRHYYWNELNNAVIKDGLLTIDLKNNKLIQKQIEDPGSASAERDFNEFCLNRLNAERSMPNAALSLQR